LNGKGFRGIGSLIIRNPAAERAELRYEPGPIISMEMLRGSRVQQDTFRGPFKNSKDWLAARFGINNLDWKERLENEAEYFKKKDLKERIELAEDLQKSLPDFSSRTRRTR